MTIRKNHALMSLVAFYASIALLACSTPPPINGIPQAERDALVALYNSTDGDNWKNKTGWLSDIGTECSWFGVMCIKNHVYSINLPLNNLKGTIPKELGKLTELFNLKLNNNELTGSIPVELGQLSHLNLLSLSFNGISGEIPPEYGLLEGLTVLTLNNNQLTGNIPVNWVN